MIIEQLLKIKELLVIDLTFDLVIVNIRIYVNMSNCLKLLNM